jgi:hypothetical protein
MLDDKDEHQNLSEHDLDTLAAMRTSGENHGPEFLKKMADIILTMRENLASETAKNGDLLSTLRQTLKIVPSSEKSSRKTRRPQPEEPTSTPETADPSLPERRKTEKEKEDIKQCIRVLRNISSALRAARKARMAKKKLEEQNTSTYDPDEFDLAVFDDKDLVDEFYEGMPADFGRIDDSFEEKFNDALDAAAFLGTENGPDFEFSRAPEIILGNPVASCHVEEKRLCVDPGTIPTESEVGLRRDYDLTTRTDLDIRVSQIRLSIESVLHPETGFRARANTEAFGPSDYSVTWRAITNAILLVVGYAFPLRRLERLTGSELSASRVCKYLEKTAQKTLPIYLHMLDELANASVLGVDSAVARVSEWTRILETGVLPKDFLSGDLSSNLNQVMPFLSRTKGDVAPKTRLHTTILTGRSQPKNPNSLLVVYRAHARDVGNILNAILPRRTIRKTTHRSSQRFHWHSCRRKTTRLHPLTPLVVRGDLSCKPRYRQRDSRTRARPLCRMPFSPAPALCSLSRPRPRALRPRR